MILLVRTSKVRWTEGGRENDSWDCSSCIWVNGGWGVVYYRWWTREDKAMSRSSRALFGNVRVRCLLDIQVTMSSKQLRIQVFSGRLQEEAGAEDRNL